MSQIVDSADGPDRSTKFIFHNGYVKGKVTQAWRQPEEVSRIYRDHLGNPVVSMGKAKNKDLLVDLSAQVYCRQDGPKYDRG